MLYCNLQHQPANNQFVSNATFRRTKMSQKQTNARDYLQDIAKRHSITDLTCRELAQKLDEEDELSHLRQNFHIPRMATLPEGK
jgi:ribosome-binding protein aMBF1 (putative translation factor)